jgi:biopolymer transport protein ExbD
VDLPKATGLLSLPKALEVRVTLSEVAVGDPPVARIKLRNGAFLEGDLRDGIEGLLVTPLHAALTTERKQAKDGKLTILADRKTPYRALTQVLYSAGQAEFDEFYFALEKDARLTALTIMVPRASDAQVSKPPGTPGLEPDPTVMVSGQGYHFSRMGDPEILPKPDGSLDYRAFEARLREIKTSIPDGRHIIIGMTDDQVFDTLIQTMLVAAGPADKPLFPDIMLTR